MSLPRFYLPPVDWRAESLSLTGDEALHCGRVMRKTVGDEVEIFDGAGRVALSQITAVRKAEVSLQMLREWQHPPLEMQVHLLPALIKAEPWEWLLEKAVELGAASVQPVITERTVVHLTGEHLEKKMQKWRRHMIESAKQCHTPWLPRLELPCAFASAIQGLPREGVKILPALSEKSRTLRDVSLGLSSRVAFVVIGPEGDFTAGEELLAEQAGFTPVTLGPLILRAETAAITTLAVLSQLGGWNERPEMRD